MEQQNHPIILDKVFFTRSIVIAIPQYNSSDTTLLINPENNIELAAIEDEPGRYMATMHTTLNVSGEPVAPYAIDMECIGLFIADKNMPKDEAFGRIMITAHSVLYGAIREAVAWITGRQPYGQIMLGLSILQQKPSDKTD